MGIIILLRRLHIWYIPIYIALGTALWLATFESGVHATIAGVVLGLATPAKPQQTKEEGLAALEWLRDKGENIYPVDVRLTAMELRESRVSVAERIESALHPISSFIIIPIFALANAGVNMGDGITSRRCLQSSYMGCRSWLNNRKDFRYHIHDVAWNEAALYKCTVWTEFLFPTRTGNHSRDRFHRFTIHN